MDGEVVFLLFLSALWILSPVVAFALGASILGIVITMVGGAIVVFGWMWLIG